MQELYCDNCPQHIGYMSGSAPHGFILCHDCHEMEEARSNSDDESDSD